MFKKSKIAAFILVIVVNYGCSSDDGNNYQEIEPLVNVPDNFPSFIDSQTNPLTKDGIELGKKLFFDKRLSSNNTVSCASCHHPNLAFTDGVALSNIGVSGNFLHRNSPTLVNLAWSTNGLFWDGGSTNLESQAFAPLAHPDELFQNLNQLIDELNADAIYPILFDKAFQQEITQSGIVKALAQFQRTLVSGNSKYDKYIRNEPNGTLSTTELQGLALVEQFCFTCHTTPLLTDNLYHNNGLDNDFSDTSHEGMFQGRFRVTNNLADLGKFRTPTLRNIEKTGPYMHDGRFSTLEQVVNHYSSGVQYSTTLHPTFQQNGAIGFSFTEEEKLQLIAFLKTLTDYEFLNNPKFSE